VAETRPGLIEVKLAEPTTPQPAVLIIPGEANRGPGGNVNSGADQPFDRYDRDRLSFATIASLQFRRDSRANLL
jgi:hypothetical protein